MKFARALRRTPAARCCAEDLPALPDELEKRESAERTLDVDGEPVTLDELGPIVVSKDGKLGHLSNWHEMTESEQAAALKFVAARNAKRRAALLKNRGGAVSANLLRSLTSCVLFACASRAFLLLLVHLSHALDGRQHSAGVPWRRMKVDHHFDLSAAIPVENLGTI